jgi:hypothetical protein
MKFSVFAAGETDLCANRLNRYQQRNSTGRIDEVQTNGTGRATVIHFHGEASVPSMDGWAEQFFCHGETKVTAWQPTSVGLLVFCYRQAAAHEFSAATPASACAS